MKVIITGATGMVGKGVLLECLADDSVEKALVINRRSVGLEHDKFQEVLVKDFFDLTEIENKLIGYDACFFCLGVSSAGMAEAAYHRVTHDLTLHFAHKLLEHNPRMVFCYVSGAGTDSSEKGRIMWARVKGKTENALLELPFKDAYMFRPGYIQPLKGTRSTVRSYQFIYTIFKPIYPLLALFPSAFTDTVKIGKAMLNAARNGCSKKRLSNADIDSLSKNL